MKCFRVESREFCPIENSNEESRAKATLGISTLVTGEVRFAFFD